MTGPSNSPDFICVGTFRAGTTWLQKVLSAHPMVYLPFEKETKFFSRYYGRGFTWYSSFFQPDREKVIGEICPTYLAHPESPKRMKKHLPNLKIIVLLRNPVDQILSLYKLHLMRGEESRPIGDAIRLNSHYIDNVRYFRHISNFLECFQKEQLLILFYEDLKTDKDAFLKRIYHFLNIKELGSYTDGFVNKSGKPFIKFIDIFIAKTGDFMRENNLYQLKEILLKTGLVDFIKRINQGKSDFIEMPDDTARYIVKMLDKDIDRLSKLTNRNLSSWKSDLVG